MLVVVAFMWNSDEMTIEKMHPTLIFHFSLFQFDLTRFWVFYKIDVRPNRAWKSKRVNNSRLSRSWTYSQLGFEFIKSKQPRKLKSTVPN